MEAWMNGWMDGTMDGWMDGRLEDVKVARWRHVILAG